MPVSGKGFWWYWMSSEQSLVALWMWVERSDLNRLSSEVICGDQQVPLVEETVKWFRHRWVNEYTLTRYRSNLESLRIFKNILTNL